MNAFRLISCVTLLSRLQIALALAIGGTAAATMSTGAVKGHKPLPLLPQQVAVRSATCRCCLALAGDGTTTAACHEGLSKTTNRSCSCWLSRLLCA
jgi:hypothetical protein